MTKKLDLREFIRLDDFVFDVGACVGAQTQEYLDCGAYVVAFEPNPVMQKILHEKFDEEPKVLIDHRGLWEFTGVLRFHVSTTKPSTSTFIDSVPEYYKAFHAPGHIQWDKDIEVSVFILDEAFELYGVPHFVKIDVESAEQFVLRGMHTIVPFLSIEFYPAPLSTFEATLPLLKALGYKQFNYIINRSSNYEIVLCSNYAFDDWVDYDTILKALRREPVDPSSSFGDIYAKA